MSCKNEKSDFLRYAKYLFYRFLQLFNPQKNKVLAILISRLNNWRFKTNSTLVKSRDIVLNSFRVCSLFVALFSLGLIVYYYGNSHSYEREKLIFKFNK